MNDRHIDLITYCTILDQLEKKIKIIKLKLKISSLRSKLKRSSLLLAPFGLSTCFSGPKWWILLQTKVKCIKQAYQCRLQALLFLSPFSVSFSLPYPLLLLWEMLWSSLLVIKNLLLIPRQNCYLDVLQRLIVQKILAYQLDGIRAHLELVR